MTRAGDGGYGREEWLADDGVPFDDRDEEWLLAHFGDDNWQQADEQPQSAVPAPGAHEIGGAFAGGLGKHARLTAWVRGRVQGVGFRWWVRRNALELGLVGVAENLVDGRVKVVAEGDQGNLAELLSRLESPGTPGHVAQVTYRWDQPRGGLAGFVER